MTTPSILIAAGCVMWLACVIGIFWPLISSDMRRAVERGDRPKPDVTEMTLMAFGPSLWAAVAAAGLWLGAGVA